MARVPYSPVPDTAAQATGAPLLHTDAPVAAFGGATAEALKGFGHTLGQAGDRLFGEVVKLRQDEMETNVNEAVTKSLLQSGELDNKFRVLEGKNPQENLEEHKTALVGSRESIRDSLKTDYERKMFDKETMRRLGYDVVNAGNYAATQMKQYQRQSYEAKSLTIAERAVRDPNNEGYLSDAIESTKEIEAAVGSSLGEDAPATKMRIDRKVGKLIGDVAASKAIRDPEGGMKLLERYEKQIPPDIYQAALEKVTQRKIQFYGALDSRKLSGGVTLPENSVVTKNAPAINKIAQDKGWGEGTTFTPENIYKLVRQESGGRNLPPNQYGYAGYFQMKPSEFGLTPADFRSMSFEDQLNLYAGSYLKKYGYTGTQDLGVLNAAPAYKDAPDTQIAYPAGSKEAAANPAWVRHSAAGGAVTVGGIKAWNEAGGSGMSVSPEVSLPEVAEKAAALAKERFPDDPISQERYLESVLSHSQRNAALMRSQINMQKQSQRNQIDSVLYRGGTDNRGPTSWEEAERLQPGFLNLVEEASKTNPAIQKHVRDTFTYNSKSDVDPSPERDARYKEYLGLSYGLNPGDREKFLSVSVGSLDLPKKETQELYKKQLDIQKGLRDTSKLREAMYTMGPLLNEAKIFNMKDDPAKTRVYNIFQGAYLEKLQEFETKEKRFPNEQERLAIGAPLLKTIAGSWIPYTANRKAFVPPSDAAESIKKNFVGLYGREPTSMEIGQIYQRLETQKNAR